VLASPVSNGAGSPATSSHAVAGFSLGRRAGRPSFNAPNIVVAEADDAPCFQTIDFKRSRGVYKSLYAPFVSLLGRHYLDYDHKELPIFVLKSHLVAFSASF
jgi:hypothetical protein